MYRTLQEYFEDNDDYRLFSAVESSSERLGSANNHVFVNDSVSENVSQSVVSPVLVSKLKQKNEAVGRQRTSEFLPPSNQSVLDLRVTDRDCPNPPFWKNNQRRLTTSGCEESRRRDQERTLNGYLPQFDRRAMPSLSEDSEDVNERNRVNGRSSFSERGDHHRFRVPQPRSNNYRRKTQSVRSFGSYNPSKTSWNRHHAFRNNNFLDTSIGSRSGSSTSSWRRRPRLSSSFFQDGRELDYVVQDVPQWIKDSFLHSIDEECDSNVPTSLPVNYGNNECESNGFNPFGDDTIHDVLNWTTDISVCGDDEDLPQERETGPEVQNIKCKAAEAVRRETNAHRKKGSRELQDFRNISENPRQEVQTFECDPSQVVMQEADVHRKEGSRKILDIRNRSENPRQVVQTFECDLRADEACEDMQGDIDGPIASNACQEIKRQGTSVHVDPRTAQPASAHVDKSNTTCNYEAYMVEAVEDRDVTMSSPDSHAGSEVEGENVEPLDTSVRRRTVQFIEWDKVSAYSEDMLNELEELEMSSQESECESEGEDEKAARRKSPKKSTGRKITVQSVNDQSKKSPSKRTKSHQVAKLVHPSSSSGNTRESSRRKMDGKVEEDQKVKVLKNWSTFLNLEGELCIKGDIIGSNQEVIYDSWMTCEICERLNNNTVKSKVGTTYNLHGPMTTFGGIPQYVCDAFELGFPRNWRRIISKWKDDRSAVRSSLTLNGATSNACEALEQIIHGDGKIDIEDLHRRGLLNVSQRGRIRMPPLKFWINEKLEKAGEKVIYSMGPKDTARHRPSLVHHVRQQAETDVHKEVEFVRENLKKNHDKKSNTKTEVAPNANRSISTKKTNARGKAASPEEEDAAANSELGVRCLRSAQRSTQSNENMKTPDNKKKPDTNSKSNDVPEPAVVPRTRRGRKPVVNNISSTNPPVTGNLNSSSNVKKRGRPRKTPVAQNISSVELAVNRSDCTNVRSSARPKKTVEKNAQANGKELENSVKNNTEENLRQRKGRRVNQNSSKIGETTSRTQQNLRKRRKAAKYAEESDKSLELSEDEEYPSVAGSSVTLTPEKKIVKKAKSASDQNATGKNKPKKQNLPSTTSESQNKATSDILESIPNSKAQNISMDTSTVSNVSCVSLDEVAEACASPQKRKKTLKERMEKQKKLEEMYFANPLKDAFADSPGNKKLFGSAKPLDLLDEIDDSDDDFDINQLRTPNAKVLNQTKQTPIINYYDGLGLAVGRSTAKSPKAEEDPKQKRYIMHEIHRKLTQKGKRVVKNKPKLPETVGSSETEKLNRSIVTKVNKVYTALSQRQKLSDSMAQLLERTAVEDPHSSDDEFDDYFPQQ